MPQSSLIDLLLLAMFKTNQPKEIAFKCDFTEYENLKEIQDNYQDIKNIDDLENNTTVIQVPNTKKIIIQNY
jgi:hypothetical protein